MVVLRNVVISWWRAAIILLAIAVLTIGISMTATDMSVFAHSGAPSGCSVTSDSKGCRRCGTLWLKKKEYHKIRYTCSNGSSGSHTQYGSCGGC